MIADGAQPARRSREKVLRRHQEQGRAVVQAAQPSPDQAHVVIGGQPAHEDVACVGLHWFAHGADVGQQIRVAQHDALGLPRAARCVLEQRCVLGLELRRSQCASPALKSLQSQRRAQTGNARPQDACGRQGRLVAEQQYGACIAEDAGLSAQVVLDLGGAQRRIDRNGNRAGQQYAHESPEECKAGGQHHGYRVATRQAPALQARRDGLCLDPQLAMSELLRRCPAADERDVPPVRSLFGVPPQDLNEGPRVARRRNPRAGLGARRH
jgi:hypothetical protein